MTHKKEHELRSVAQRAAGARKCFRRHCAGLSRSEPEGKSTRDAELTFQVITDLLENLEELRQLLARRSDRPQLH